MTRIAATLLFALFLATPALADDASACRAGDTQACARIGELKSLGALKADGSKDVDHLVEVCGQALASATRFDGVARACGQLFNPALQRSMSALVSMPADMLEPVLGTAYAEAYCPLLAKPVAGCRGKKAANFSSMKPAALRAALKALNAAALERELGAAKAKGLDEKFDAAFERLFGAVK